MTTKKMWACAAAMTFAGCGPGVVGDAYKGEPLATIRGEIENPLELSSEGLNVYLSWVLPGGSVVIDQVAVTPRFPAGFELNVYQPPPASAFNEDLGIYAAQVISATAANIEVFMEASATQNFSLIPDGSVFGLSPSGVAYRDPDDSTTPAGPLLSLDLQPGFQVISLDEQAVTCGKDFRTAQDACVDECFDPSTFDGIDVACVNACGVDPCNEPDPCLIEAETEEEADECPSLCFDAQEEESSRQAIVACGPTHRSQPISTPIVIELRVVGGDS